MLCQESVVMSIFFNEDLFYFQQQHTRCCTHVVVVSQNFQMGTSLSIMYCMLKFKIKIY